MLSNEMWKIFENTGNLEAYLYCKKHDEIFKEAETEEELPIAVNDTISK